MRCHGDLAAVHETSGRRCYGSCKRWNAGTAALPNQTVRGRGGGGMGSDTGRLTKLSGMERPARHVSFITLARSVHGY